MSPEYPVPPSEASGSEDSIVDLLPPDCDTSSNADVDCKYDADGDCDDVETSGELSRSDHIRSRLGPEIDPRDIADLLNTRAVIDQREMAELHQLMQLPDEAIDFPPIDSDEDDAENRLAISDRESSMPQLLQGLSHRLSELQGQRRARAEAEAEDGGTDDDGADPAAVELADAENAAYWEWYMDSCRAMGDIAFYRLPDI